MAIQQISAVLPTPSPLVPSKPAHPVPAHEVKAAPAGAPKASQSQLEQAIEDMRKAIDPSARNLQFSIDQDTGRTVVKIVDSATKETIRQFPSEEFLAMSRALDKVQGLLLKQKA
jgi:flagellar protein FlaG